MAIHKCEPQGVAKDEVTKVSMNYSLVFSQIVETKAAKFVKTLHN